MLRFAKNPVEFLNNLAVATMRDINQVKKKKKNVLKTKSFALFYLVCIKLKNGWRGSKKVEILLSSLYPRSSPTIFGKRVTLIRINFFFFEETKNPTFEMNLQF